MDQLWCRVIAICNHTASQTFRSSRSANASFFYQASWGQLWGLDAKGANLLLSSPEILGLKRAFWSAGSSAKLRSACNACSASMVSISKVSQMSLLSPMESREVLLLHEAFTIHVQLLHDYCGWNLDSRQTWLWKLTFQAKNSLYRSLDAKKFFWTLFSTYKSFQEWQPMAQRMASCWPSKQFSSLNSNLSAGENR